MKQDRPGQIWRPAWNVVSKTDMTDRLETCRTRAVRFKIGSDRLETCPAVAE